MKATVVGVGKAELSDWLEPCVLHTVYGRSGHPLVLWGRVAAAKSLTRVPRLLQIVQIGFLHASEVLSFIDRYTTGRTEVQRVVEGFR